MASIYLIRHGQASFGTDDYDRLSTLGCRQAEILGHYLRDCNIQFDAVYSGNLQRQQKTAALAIASQAIVPQHLTDPRFNEVNNDEHIEHLLPKVIEQQPEIEAIVDAGLGNSKNFQKVIEAAFNYWVSPGNEHPQVQSWLEYSTGTRAAMQELMQLHGSGKTIGVFTSGGTIATIVAQTLGLSGAQTYQFYEPVINCSVSRLFYANGGAKTSLSYFNDHSFLDVMGRQLGEELVTYR